MTFEGMTKCDVLSPYVCYSKLNKTSSLGFGAKERGVLNRMDIDLQDYIYNYTQTPPNTNVIMTASQKDEIRVAGKTARLFTSYPVEHTFIATLVLGDFADKFYKMNRTNGAKVSAVGDSPQRGAFVYYKRILNKHPYKYCTDTSAQDASVPAEFIHLVYDFIAQFYDFNEYEKALFNKVRYNSVNKLMNVNGLLYLVDRGLGSGDYLTIVINIVWRLYMVLDNYHHDIEKFEEENEVIINGDDLAMSSIHDDLDLSSPHATIEWAGRPVSWEEMDFCSIKWEPFIHHDPKKVKAVLMHRKKKKFQFSPEMEIQRLGGILLTLSTKEMHTMISNKMFSLAKKHNLEHLLYSLYVPYEEIYEHYNSWP
jgi:hypothetical protein